MPTVDDNKAVVGRWFTEFWGKTCNLAVVDELASPDMLLQYSLHEPRRGRDDIKAFMTDFREAFPDLNFWGTADLIAEGDYVVGRWAGGGTHTGPAFSDFLAGSLTANTGRTYAVHGHDGPQAEGWQDRRGDRPRRWRHCSGAVGLDQDRGLAFVARSVPRKWGRPALEIRRTVGWAKRCVPTICSSDAEPWWARR